ncbi:hypothetical protein [Achromobacter insuavis]|uniref:hypothetical protein n=2 Tax=Pseudomonadati TaxID=3379134 RepID=UPI0029DA8003|nr:hypothetical protein [Achromobacter sp.]MCG2601748.1 hypothetical protein [Achromobacter sp.]
MNLHGIAGPIIAAVNPMTLATIKYSDGYEIGPGRKQVPKYRVVPDVQAQVQPLSAGDLKHLEAQNIQGVQRSVYLYGDIQGVVRPAEKGGDLLVFGGQVWLVTVVFETWPDWCKVGVTLQMDAAP